MTNKLKFIILLAISGLMAAMPLLAKNKHDKKNDSPAVQNDDSKGKDAAADTEEWDDEADAEMADLLKDDPPSKPGHGEHKSTKEKEPIFTLSGPPDPTFEELLKTHRAIGKNGQPELLSSKPILGSTVHVNHKFLEQGMGQVADPTKIKKLNIMFAIPHGVKPNAAAKNYTRWYQVDGNTQIFRMFDHDMQQNLKTECRVEVHTPPYSTENRIVCWEGSYCVPDVPAEYNWGGKGWGGGIAFQVGNVGKVMGHSYPYFSMGARSDYRVHHRFAFQKPWSGEKTHILMDDAKGKPFPMRFRYDGHYYEISTKTPDGKYKVLDGGTLPTATGKVSFRWGCYVGHASKTGVTGNKLIFVTGAHVYFEEGSITPPSWVPASCLTERKTENPTKPVKP